MERPAQESGPPGHPDDDFRACHSAGTPPAAYLTSYQSIHGIARESRPAVIPEEQMERFRFMLDYSPEAVEICSTPLAAGDAVKVIKGPLAGLEGELVMIGGKSKVAVRLDMLGCAHVDMPIGYVEKINF